jgi:membrane protease YdiL (CAAX protease family)
MFLMTFRFLRRGHRDVSSTISFDRGLTPLVLFLVSTSLLATVVPLYVYPNLGTYATLVAMGLAFVLIAVVAWLVLRYEGLRVADVGLGQSDVAPGVLVIAGLYVFINAVAAAFAFYSSGTVRFTVPGDVSAGAWVAMALLQLLFVGIAEEFAFRAYVQNKLVALVGGGDNRVRKAGGILLGVLLFALWHIPQRVFGQGLTSPAEIIGTLMVVVILGTFLGVLYEYTRNVVLAGLLHGTFNWSFVFIADVSADLAVLLAIPVFVALVWYYRRWASATGIPGFGPQKQAMRA